MATGTLIILLALVTLFSVLGWNAIQAQRAKRAQKEFRGSTLTRSEAGPFPKGHPDGKSEEDMDGTPAEEAKRLEKGALEPPYGGDVGTYGNEPEDEKTERKSASS